MAKLRCAVCGEGPPDSKAVGVIYRINKTGKTGVWACLPHIEQGVNNLAHNVGPDEVHEQFKSLIKETN